MNDNYTVYDFLNSLSKLGKLLEESLEEYQKNNSSIKTAELDGKLIKPQQEHSAEKQSESLSETKDSYNIAITDFTVDTYAKAMHKISEYLNDIVFAMRCGTFRDARAVFIFSDVSYDLMWNKTTDRFEGREETEAEVKFVVWNEIKNKIFYIDAVNDSSKKSSPESKKDLSDSDASRKCSYSEPHKSSSLFPYEPDCVGCEHMNDCFDSSIDSEADHKELVCDSDGNAVADKEIPTLEDYTSNNAERVNSNMQNDNISAQDVYNTINTVVLENVNTYMDDIIKGVNKILKYKLYKIVRTPEENDINHIKFSFEDIRTCMPIKLNTPLYSLVPAETIRAAVQDIFKFKDVELEDTDENMYLICTLI